MIVRATAACAYLCKFRLPLWFGGFVPVAARDLHVAVHAANHQQLLELKAVIEYVITAVTPHHMRIGEQVSQWLMNGEYCEDYNLLRALR